MGGGGRYDWVSAGSSKGQYEYGLLSGDKDKKAPDAEGQNYLEVVWLELWGR